MRFKLTILSVFFIISAALMLLPCGSLTAKGKSLGLRTVVIDAGHGGKDPGGVSRDKSAYEKNLVLDIAKRFGGKIVEKYPDVKVIYTRSTDVYVALNERADIANRNNADLFISIHTNAASSTSAHGASVHVLGQSSNPNRDLYASNLDVCKRENSVMLLEEDYTTAYQGFDPNSPESFIFFNLMRSSHFENSILFAEEVDRQLRKTKFTISNYTGIHQDPFWVLWRTSMPAVLLELGFITNPSDLSVLKSQQGREDISDKLLAAFSSYKAYYDSSIDAVKQAVKPETVQDVTEKTPEVDSGTYYGIQIFGLKKLLKAGDPAFKGLDVHSVVTPGSEVVRYVSGRWGSASKAVDNLDAVRRKFPDAYVVKVSDGVVSRVK
jgi:N-acetylmuramoyl-L-alanine amidase